jgi:predicted TIM-barrel fold metal-dependent hydrolase
MGYPYCDDLNMVAMGHPNVYVCLSLLIPWAGSSPRNFARIIGEALRWVGPDKIIWGTDFAGFGAQIRGAVTGMRDFQIPGDMQEGYGYPAITDEDRRKIFGENLGRMLGIDTSKRRI